MREYAQSQQESQGAQLRNSLAEYDQPKESPPHNSADALARAGMKVERIVDALEGLLSQIAGSNTINKAMPTAETQRPVPVLGRMLESLPAHISVQSDRAAKLMEEIRVALGL